MIKYTIILILIWTNLTAQSPFDDFNENNKRINIHQLEDNIEFKIFNENKNDLISYGILRENKLYFYDKDENLVLLYTLDDKEDKFLSRDPKENSFVGLSPYTFGMNNPINFIDPNGDSTFSVGDEQEKYSSSIESRHPNLQVETIEMKQDIYYQKISIKQNYKGSLSDEEKLLIEASESKEINTYMFATENVKMLKWSNSDAERSYIGGGLYGRIEVDKKGNKYGISYLNYHAISKYISSGITKKGDITSHETLEMYLSIKDDLDQEEAHKKTLLIVPTAQTAINKEYFKLTNEDIFSFTVIGSGRKIPLDRLNRNTGLTMFHDQLKDYIEK